MLLIWRLFNIENVITANFASCKNEVRFSKAVIDFTRQQEFLIFLKNFLKTP
jgi:hypothetical protein